ncbi:MAG: hypothetical protein ACRDOI_33865 [Trebonia sp.]
MLSSTTLAVIAWGSLAVCHPFTLGIAKQQTPREVWGQPVFIHSNVVITTVWAASFTVAACVLAAIVHAGDPVGVRIVIQVLGFVIPMLCTTQYLAVVRARAQRALG